MDGKNGRN